MIKHAPFYIQKGNVFLLPTLHYNMEMTLAALQAFREINPACVAVELAETMEEKILHGVSRLPDISLVSTEVKTGERLFYLIEPCDPMLEALRSAAENNIPGYCIDLDLDDYPNLFEPFPDPYAIQKIGLKKYYQIYEEMQKNESLLQDAMREEHMAKRLKELSLRYDTVLFICGMSHADSIAKLLDQSRFKTYESIKRDEVLLTTPDEESVGMLLSEWGWISRHYEEVRDSKDLNLDRQRLIFKLYRQAADNYLKRWGGTFPAYHFRNLMKFARNYALIKGRLLPDLYQILSAAKGSVDHNYAYEVFELATSYFYYQNVDNLKTETLSPEEVWGHSKLIRFHLKEPSRKAFSDYERRKNKSKPFCYPPGPFSICSYPPEDVAIEGFGKFLQRKAIDILTEEGARTVPFTSSIEDGIDTRETIRHFAEKKLYVKTRGKPPGGVGSVVMIFDEDSNEEGKTHTQKFPWATTWIGEHAQESDMAFYATFPSKNVIGPGISRCEYGGFMMSYPPRRLQDVWSDPDYEMCRTKAEVLLVAAIDYSLKPQIVYVASKPPRSQIKSFARRFGKKVVYLPIGQLSPITLKKLRSFHVLDSHDKRDIAGEYIL